MKDAQKPDHVSLNTLIGRMREGRFVIPDFQREFEWAPWDIRDLMRSIFSDYYIGSLLLWKAKDQNIKLLACEGLYGYAGGGSPEYIVLDGQQRLTAMHYAFLAPDMPLPNRAKRAIYFIHVDKFMAGETDDAFSYEWLSKKTQSMMENEPALFERHMFPLSVLGGRSKALFRWTEEYKKFWQARAENAANDEERALAMAHVENATPFEDEVSDILDEYQISYIELDKEIGVEKVCDIFTQINSKGVQLDVFDLLNALMKPKDIQLKHMYREARDRLGFVETPKMNVYILQVMSILRQSYCSPKYLYFLQPGVEKPVRLPDGTRRQDILVADSSEFVTLWNQAVDALERVIALLRHPQEYGAVGQAYIPYASIVPAFAAINTLVSAQPAKRQLSARRKVRLWYWASVFLNRYSSSVESTAARDFGAMREWMAHEDAKPDLIDEFALSYRSIDMRSEVKRGSSIYSAIFNLFVLAGARDWMSGDVPPYGDLDDHHIVPAWWGRENKVGPAINSILNRSPLTSDTNRNVIREKLPNEYLPDLIDENGEAAVVAILESHFISKTALDILLRDPFTPEDYEDFIAERHRTLLDGIENLLIKERLDLPANLRALDASIEQIELALRRVIVEAIENDPSLLPPHLLGNAQERIQRALRKNAALSADRFDRAEGVLEHFDLREVQDTILSKALWERFADRFKTKEALSQKFSQLADLRNTIRHSRTVDEVTLKEGEASVLWFNKVLNS
ncbi:MAG TPA: DUF262 domain-containing protein [Hyphomonas sp.]|uniref:GmrSD restriction endonuclease domain-containing protein n=1 Tax=Hyphomonadaceae TaxID=69657 RepID=UPI000458EF14|nr:MULTISPECIES: DUF262 domain-containing protein [Hyphomonadaceae]MAN92125.1 DUF262 domain-containing protein [Hyphomonadaceae bacterium]OUY01440.1 MAG: hypothetical protein CBB65_01110 [Hyphomonadaceae bacterium TMED5]KCZ48726.1 hypothetical protein HY17_15260 [Hyphomonas sp. CY54-11-8]MAF57122.1 DUF262 domain-containing protein [Ponticaulis sp.]MAI89066.1 DUF262 domain-containing protein [Ponticaulis sp.]|tara:strand:+ start:36231 stop:38453 length:2223 start_codon:yes stop_codon:yes gene_type:complete